MLMRGARLAGLALIASLLVGCGSMSKPAAAQPSPSLSPDDQELLAQLSTIGYQLYETPLTTGTYIFEGSGVLYDGTTFELGYNGLVIEEWKATSWNPSSGKCADSDPKFSWNCAPLLTTPGGHVLYAAPSGGLAGYPPDLAHVYFELGTTELNMKGATGHVPTRQDVAMMADAFKPTKAIDAVVLNQKAHDYTALLQRTAASRVDFKTYLPSADIEGFTVDKRGFENVVDPLHPYLYLHFGRVAQGNVAGEFSAYEFKDPVPLSPAHCGVDNPEINLGLPCKLWFTSAKGVAVYSTYNSTRLDLAGTRVVFGLSPDINKLNQSTTSQFVDSFSEVPPQSI